MLGDFAALVGLQLADEMPLQAEFAQGLDLGHGFLNVVFAESGLAFGRQGPHRLRRFGFRHRQKPRHWPFRGGGRVI